ncbi:hypothetical protein CXF67_10265 [Psychroflexus sp. MES1-P1E]|nr:hypothetical protein CXF67_10265 [Psychroflexus sp. MES1-P1E]
MVLNMVSCLVKIVSFTSVLYLLFPFLLLSSVFRLPSQVFPLPSPVYRLPSQALFHCIFTSCPSRSVCNPATAIF